MSGIIPERLVTIRGYATPELAEEDHRSLVEAGLDATVSSTYFGHRGYSSVWRAQVELKVPESQKEEASRLLGALEEEFPVVDSNRRPDAELTCPLCHASDPNPLPPYGLMVVCGLVGGLILLLRFNAAAPLVIVITAFLGFAILPRLAAKFDKWRCKACGTRWGDMPRKRLSG